MTMEKCALHHFRCGAQMVYNGKKVSATKAAMLTSV